MDNDTTEPHQKVGILAAWIVVNSSLVAVLWTLFVRTYVKQWQLNDAETVARVWSRTPDIILQPMAVDTLYAIIVGSGSAVMLAEVISSGANFFGVSSHEIYIWVFPLAEGFGQALAGSIGKVFLKTHRWEWAFFTAFLWLAMLYTVGVIHVYKTTGFTIIPNREAALPLTILIGSILSLVVSVVAGAWVDRLAVYPVSKRSYSPRVLPAWVQLDRSILLASGPIILAEIGHTYLSTTSRPLSTVSSLAINASNFLSLSVCAIVAIILVNRALLAEEFQWHWRSFAIAAVPAAILQAAVIVIGAIRHGLDGHAWRTAYAIIRVIECGACGSIGVYSALSSTLSYLEIDLPEPLALPSSNSTESEAAAVVENPSTDTALID